MKKIILFIILNVMISFHLFSQDLPKPDGYWWISLANSVYHSNQVSFLTGFLDGINLGNSISLGGFESNSICIQTGIESFSQTQILDTLSIMNIQDEITKFYTDTTKLCISLDHAFWVAALRLSKKDSKQINKLVEMYRKEDCKEFTIPKNK